MDLTLYQSASYVDGGRAVSFDPETNKTIGGFDCFGQVRHALHYQFGGPLLESFSGIFKSNEAQMTSEFEQNVAAFELCSPQAGALACCFHKVKTNDGFKDVFHHIGICIDDAEVMHTASRHGYAVVPVRVFKRLAAKVEFYRYVGKQ